MRTLLLHIILLIFVAACTNPKPVKPIWANATDTLLLPHANLEFLTATEGCKATLLTCTQPIALPVNYAKGKLVAELQRTGGIIEGNAEICLSVGTAFFYYPVFLKNGSVTKPVTKDYRSPKTVNPDSALHHQRLLHRIDAYRNLVTLDNSSRYFREEEVYLGSKTGTFRAVKNLALSSYYVQPGSCVNIPLTLTYNIVQNAYCIKAGPLKDRYNNMVGNGTMVAFIYGNNRATYRVERTLQDGFATAMIPAEMAVGCTLQARVNETVSCYINLKK